MCRSFALACLSVVSLGAPFSLLHSAEPPFGDFIRHCPLVDSSDGVRRGIKIRGHVVEDGTAEFTFVARFCAPNRFLLCLGDQSGTPIVTFNDSIVCVYDNVLNRVLYFNKGSMVFDVAFNSDSIKYKFDITKSNSRSAIRLDLRSLHTILLPDAMVAESENVYDLTRLMYAHRSIFALVEPRRCFPYREIRDAKIGHSHSELHLQEIAIDEDVRELWPAHPTKNLFEGIIKLEDASNNNLLANLSISTFLSRAIHGRFATQYPSTRSDYEKKYHLNVDWEYVKSHDYQNSQRVRGILGSVFEINEGKRPAPSVLSRKSVQ